MQAGARAEWHPLRHVLVHEPGIEVFFALLSPQHHLYERFFDQGQARQEHRQLCDELHGMVENFDVTACVARRLEAAGRATWETPSPEQ